MNKYQGRVLVLGGLAFAFALFIYFTHYGGMPNKSMIIAIVGIPIATVIGFFAQK